MADAWGTSWGSPSTWGNSWNSGGAAAADTHDGGREPHKRRRLIPEIEVEPFDREFDRSRERLREQIRLALEGPDAPEVREALEAVATDSVQPLHERIDVDRLKADVLDIVEKAYSAYLAQIEEEDDLLLL